MSVLPPADVTRGKGFPHKIYEPSVPTVTLERPIGGAACSDVTRGTGGRVHYVTRVGEGPLIVGVLYCEVYVKKN